jgi:hypothetical protein
MQWLKSTQREEIRDSDVRWILKPFASSMSSAFNKKPVLGMKNTETAD